MHKVKRWQVYLNKVQTILSLHWSREKRLEFENLKEPKEPNVFPNQTPKTNKIIFCTPQKDVKNVWSCVSDFKRFLFQQALWSIYMKHFLWFLLWTLSLLNNYVKARKHHVLMLFSRNIFISTFFFTFDLNWKNVSWKQRTYYISISFSRKM